MIEPQLECRVEGGVAEVLHQRASSAPDTEFVKCGGDWLTYGDLDSRSDRVAGALASLGIGKGDSVAIILPNRIEMLELFFACAKLGAVQVPLNYWLKGDFLRYQLADCGATVLVADAPGYRAAAELLADTDINQVVLVDEVPLNRQFNSVAYADLSNSSDPAPSTVLHSADPLSIIYTSGTTGLPKGCIVPNGAFIACGKALGAARWVERGDRIFTAFPLFHTSGQIIALMSALMNEVSVCFEAEFSARAFISRAAQEKATVLYGVGPMGLALLASPESSSDREHNIRSASFIPMAVEYQNAFAQRFGVPVVGETYGQTECQPITISPPGGGKPGSAGRPTGNFEVRLVDDHDTEVATGSVGEIVVRPRFTDVMFQGYWNKAAETVAASRNLWHHTGDYGVMDEEGFLFFVDRKKDALRRRGENISSIELEAAIRAHPAVAQVAVCAVPSPLGEDDVKACIVVTSGAELEPVELFEFFKNTLPYYAIPRYVDIRESLPVNAMSRPMKHLLRAEGVPAGAWDFEKIGLSVAKSDRR